MVEVAEHFQALIRLKQTLSLQKHFTNRFTLAQYRPSLF